MSSDWPKFSSPEAAQVVKGLNDISPQALGELGQWFLQNFPPKPIQQMVGYGRVPGHQLAYTEFTSNVSVTVTTEGSPTDVVSAGQITFDGTPVIVEFYSYLVEPPAVAAQATVLNLWDGSTDLGRLGAVEAAAAASTGCPVLVKRKVTPSAGSHTYKIRSWISAAGTGTVYGGTGGTGTRFPGYIRITRA